MYECFELTRGGPDVNHCNRKWIIPTGSRYFCPNLNSYEYDLIVFIRFVIQLIKVKTNEQFVLCSINVLSNCSVSHEHVPCSCSCLCSSLQIIPRYVFLNCTIFWSWNFIFDSLEWFKISDAFQFRRLNIKGIFAKLLIPASLFSDSLKSNLRQGSTDQKPSDITLLRWDFDDLFLSP